MSFAYLLKKFRQQRELSLEQLADLVNNGWKQKYDCREKVNAAFLQKLEANSKILPPRYLADRIAHVLQLAKTNMRGYFVFNMAAKYVIPKQLVNIFIEDEEVPLAILEILMFMDPLRKKSKTRKQWMQAVNLLDDCLQKIYFT